MIPGKYEAEEAPGVGWAVVDPYGELLRIFTEGDDPGRDAKEYADFLNNPGRKRKPSLRIVK